MAAKRKSTVPDGKVDTVASRVASPAVPATFARVEPEAALPAAEPAGDPTTPMTTMEHTMKTAEDFLAFGQSNVDAFVKSGQIWAQGVQDLSKQVAASAQASFDDTLAAMKAFATVKSPKDALDVQASLARSSLEKAVAETGKLTDASLKLAEQAFAPITAQMNAAVEKFAKVA